MEYAILFSGMGVTILFLLYKNFQLSKNNFIHTEIIKAIAEGEIEIKRTRNGIEAVMKKEV